MQILTNETELVAAINNSRTSDNTVFTVLKTDERVIARVTDGIYRQPASALRELISNAYDADATRVVIKTDAPRFSRLSIEDDGNGMTPEVLGHMLMHIGGSAKRRKEGEELGITDINNPKNSPKGRKLIGKIGIGIFSVSQLTYNFQIITKTKGDDFRTIAIINLRQYTDDVNLTDGPDENSYKNNEYESGKVTIWREKANDGNSHGTTIILNNIRPQARGTLQSKEIWAAIEQNSDNPLFIDQIISPPKYHVGRINIDDQILRQVNNKTKSVPWDSTDEPADAFRKLVDAVWGELENFNPNPQLDKIFDYYLQMIWSLSLAVPVAYVQKHLFDMRINAWAEGYLLANSVKGSAKEITNIEDKTIRDILELTEGSESLEFKVYIDDLELLRPIKYKDLPISGAALKKPIIFFGKCTEEFIKFPVELSGGPLSFEAYLFWNPKIAPVEHRGSLIRINGASGTLFDSTFMRYQIAEIQRLRQITCEIFVHQGFDSALNIDRESFNFAHPHAVYLTRWLHSALRQLASTQKKISSGIRSDNREDILTGQLSDIEKIAVNTWRGELKDDYSYPPTVAISSNQEPLFKADILIQKSHEREIERKNLSNNSQVNSAKMIAITQILASFSLLEKLTQQEQNRLLNAIYNVIESAE